MIYDIIVCHAYGRQVSYFLFLILKALHPIMQKKIPPETRGDYLKKGDQLYENFKSYNTLISLADFAASAFLGRFSIRTPFS